MKPDRTESAQQRSLGLLPATLAALLWAAGILEFLRFVLLVGYYFDVGITQDSQLYFAMGRGLLNGLQLYTDLFETKPPLIFWLSALSIRVTANDVLYRHIHAVGLAAMPIALSLFTFRIDRSRGWATHKLWAGLAFLFGSAIASFVMTRSFGFQTEGFGVVPAVTVLLIFACNAPNTRLGWWRIIASAFCLTSAVLLKEPFAVSVAGGLVLLISSKERLADAMKVVGLSVLFLLAILLVTGSARGYFSVYLPEMFSGRVAENVVYHHYGIDKTVVVRAPIAVRGMNVVRLFQDLWSSAYRVIPLFPFLALALAVLFAAHQAAIGENDRRWPWFLIGTFALACVVRVANLAFALEQVLAILQFRVPLGNAFFQWKCMTLLFFVVVSLTMLALLSRRSPGTAKRVVATAMALYLASLAVAIGGDFSPNHFLFAVPVYVACFAATVRRVGSRPSQPCVVIALAVFACLLLLNALDSHRFNKGELDAAKMAAKQISTVALRQARLLDSLMTSCQFRRYFIITDNELSTLPTVHSPYQIGYGLLRAKPQPSPYFRQREPNVFFHDKLLKDFAETPIVVTAAGTTGVLPYPELQARFRQHFSDDAPTCAKPFLPINDISVYFRR